MVNHCNIVCGGWKALTVNSEVNVLLQRNSTPVGAHTGEFTAGWFESAYEEAFGSKLVRDWPKLVAESSFTLPPILVEASLYDDLRKSGSAGRGGWRFCYLQKQ